MDASPFRDRRFAGPEVRRILRRAAENAERDPATIAVERALTQDEIERLAADLGLPASAVRDAVHEDAGAVPAEGDPSGPRRIFFEDELDGELPVSRHEDVVDAISTALLDDAGRVQIVGRTLTWSPKQTPGDQPRQLTITVRARDGRTRVRIDEKLTHIQLALYLGLGLGLGLTGALGGGVLAAAAFHSGLVGLGVAVAVVGFALLLPYLIFGAVRRARLRSLTQLRARLGRAVREGITAEGGRKRIAAAGEEEAEREAEAEVEAEAARARR